MTMSDDLPGQALDTQPGLQPEAGRRTDLWEVQFNGPALALLEVRHTQNPVVTNTLLQCCCVHQNYNFCTILAHTQK